MPMRKGSSPATVSQNISEFHTGPTYAHTAAKFGKKRANAQAIAAALNTARRSRNKYAEGGDVQDEDTSLQDAYDPNRKALVLTVHPRPTSPVEDRTRRQVDPGWSPVGSRAYWQATHGVEPGGLLGLTPEEPPPEPEAPTAPTTPAWTPPVQAAYRRAAYGQDTAPSPEQIEAMPNAPMVNRLLGEQGVPREHTFPERAFVDPARKIIDMMRSGVDPNSEEAVEAAFDLTSSMAGGVRTATALNPGLVPQGSAGMFAGRLAKYANAAKLEEASQMKAAGESEASIWRKTGWTWDQKTGVPLFEVPDRGAALTGVVKPMPFGEGQVHIPENGSFRLGDVLKHDELYRQYPWLKDVSVVGGDPLEGGKAGEALFNKNTIKVWPQSPAALRSAILHEVNHFVQFHEGMSPGGSWSDFLSPADQALGKQLSGLNKKISDGLRQDGIPFERAAMAVKRNEMSRQLNRPEIVSPGDWNIIRSIQNHGLFDDMTSLLTQQKQYDNLVNKAYQNYEKIYGEAMSRNVERRADRDWILNKLQSPHQTMEPKETIASLRDPNAPMQFDPKLYHEQFGQHTSGPASGGAHSMESYDPLGDFDWDAFERELAKLTSPQGSHGPLKSMAEHADTWIDSSAFEKLEGQKGSNPGGIYRDPDTNDKWYIKQTQSIDHLKNEILAGKLYELAGVPVPELRHTTMQVGDQHYPAIASHMVPGKTLNKFPPGDTDEMFHLKENFPIDAWLANWDAVGTGKDNVIVNPNTMEAHRIDMGGALRYRAQGAPKGDAFGPDVPEFKTMLNPYKSPDAAQVFKGADKPEIGFNAAMRINQIPNAKIEELVYKWGPDDPAEKEKLLNTLISRKARVFSHYFDQVKESKAQAKALAANPAPVNTSQPQKLQSVTADDISKMIKNMSPQNMAISLWGIGKSGHTDAALAAKLALPVATKKAVNKLLWQMKNSHPEDEEMATYLFGSKKFPQPPKVAPKAAMSTTMKNYGKEIDEYYADLDKQEAHQYELAQGQDFAEPQKIKWWSLSDDDIYKRFKDNYNPINWQEYTPPKIKSYTTPKFTNADPADISKLGFNIKTQLYKGGAKGYHGELFDPAQKASEQAFFAADNSKVAGAYGYPEPYVARAPNAAEIDWHKFKGGDYNGYDGGVMHKLLKQARKDKLDLLVIHNISDVGGGNQTQYAFLNTAGTLRSVHAKFDPKMIHLAHSHWGLLGGGLMSYGALRSIGPEDEVKETQPMIKRASGGNTPFHLRGYQESMGAPRASDEPGVRHFTSPHTGMIHSPVPGRTDKISMNVKGGSYILPADIVSGIGQGNSMAGSSILNHFFKMGPYGASEGKIGTPKPNFGKPMQPIKSAIRPPVFRMKTPGFAEGGQEGDDGDKVPIVAAGGEFSIPPEVVKRLGGGSMKKGHDVLDHFVLKMRKKVVEDIKGLKGPKK